MPQHVRGDHLGPVRQVHLGGANGLEQAATSGLAVLPASGDRPGLLRCGRATHRRTDPGSAQLRLPDHPDRRHDQRGRTDQPGNDHRRARRTRHRTSSSPRRTRCPIPTRGWSVLRPQQLRPQQDSNLRSRLRRPLLSPLSYGGYAPPKGYQQKGPRGHALAIGAHRACLDARVIQVSRRVPPQPGTGRSHDSKGPCSLGRSWITCPGARSPARRGYPHASDAGTGTGARRGRRRGDQATDRGQPSARGL